MSKDLEQKDKETAKNKRKRDQFSVTLVGAIVYSILLVAIVAGTYLGVKTFYKSHLEKVAEAVQAVEDEEEEKRKAEMEAAAAKAAEEEAAKAAEEAAQEAAVLEPAEEVLPEKNLDVEEVLNRETWEIDYSQIVATPGERDESYSWKDTVFSKLENVQNPSQAPVNAYQFSRRLAVVDSDQKLEFQIYTNPETEKVEKITTKEYCGDDLEIINYYYENGNINYVSEYRQPVELPVNLGSTEVTSRYYFDHDTMIKYLYCENDKATEYSVAEIDQYSEGTVDQYNYMEASLLNRAYINYNIIRLLPEVVTFEGYILDEFNTGMDGAAVVVKDESGQVVKEAATNPDGFYSFELTADDSHKYTMTVQKGLMEDATIYNLVAKHGELKYCMEPVYLAYAGTGAIYNEQIMVRDAANANNGLADANVKLRSGVNNFDGDVIATGVLDSSGAITAPMKAGMYTAEIQKGGYEVCYFTIVVKSDHQAVVGYAVGDVGDNEVVTVLSWDTTLDLDLRMFSSGGARKEKSGIDSVGATIAEMNRTTKLDADSFMCYISDYSDCTAGDPYSYSMSSTNAYVSVYSSDGLQAKFHVPAGHMGIVWKPFEIRNAKILAVNEYYFPKESEGFWAQKK